MALKWKIINNNIAIEQEDKSILYPSAEEIFLIEFGRKTDFRGLEIEKPSDSLRDVEFSKYPVELKIIINNNFELQESYIKASVIITKDNFEIAELTLKDLNIDHILSNKKWFPIVKGTIEEIKDIFKEISLKETGPINIKQYMVLRDSRKEFICDNLKNSSFSKTEYISTDYIPVKNFQGNLYPYQNQGYRWLKMIVEERAGCILADEMGLGKTAQIIAVLSAKKESNIPSLVVAPVSLMENWRREIIKFAPHLTTMIHQGHGRTGFYKEFNKYNLIITSYETVYRDLSILQMIKWDVVIADEAQAIKNPFAKRTIALKEIDRNAAIAVTGTPIENRLTDIWSLADFAFPGFLGDLKEFEINFPNGPGAAEELEPIISPILLRRRVNDVAKDLPPRIDIPQVLRMNDNENQQYEILRTEIINQYGKQASLVSLIKLRMFCTHPLLQFENLYPDPSLFSKYSRLVDILEEIISNNEKVIIFTSYQKMIDILIKDLRGRFDLYCNFIDGRVEVTERQGIIDKFSETLNSAILVLNPKAAGAGLNITAANHVIHYNLEWNPAVEDQASARAYRRGQSRPVTVHRLYCADTVEEVINERIEEKRDIAEAAVVGTDGLESDNTSILKALLRSPIIKGEETNG